MPGTPVSTTLKQTHFILTITPSGRYDPHFTDEETKVQRGLLAQGYITSKCQIQDLNPDSFAL